MPLQLGFWAQPDVITDKFNMAGRNFLTDAYNNSPGGNPGVPFQEQVNMITDLGANMYRVGISPAADGTIDQIDEDRRFNTTGDQSSNGFVTQLNAAGIPQICIIRDRLFNPPPPDNPAALWSAPTQEVYDAGYTMANGFVTTYGQYFDYWELSNEIELTRNLKPGTLGMAPGDYINPGSRNSVEVVSEYMSGMNDGIKDAKPGAITMYNTGGFYPTYIMQQVLNRAASQGIYEIDICAWHTYNEHPQAVFNQTGISDIIADLWDRFRKPIWITETGTRYDGGITPAENEQAQLDWWNGSWIQNAIASPRVHKIFYFELLDQTIDLPGRNGGYGIYSFPDYTTNGFANPTPKLLAQQFLGLTT